MAKKPIKAEVKPKVKPKSKTVSGADCNISLNIFSPGHEPEEIRISVHNITGKTNINLRKPRDIANAIILGLQAKYGGKVG